MQIINSQFITITIICLVFLGGVLLLMQEQPPKEYLEPVQPEIDNIFFEKSGVSGLTFQEVAEQEAKKRERGFVGPVKIIKEVSE